MVQYAVVRGFEGWNVFRNGKRTGHYSARLCAIESAYLLALKVRAQGGTTELLVQDEGGELESWGLEAWSGVPDLVRSTVVA
jgi:hypothetical protein